VLSSEKREGKITRETQRASSPATGNRKKKLRRATEQTHSKCAKPVGGSRLGKKQNQNSSGEKSTSLPPAPDVQKKGESDLNSSPPNFTYGSVDAKTTGSKRLVTKKLSRPRRLPEKERMGYHPDVQIRRESGEGKPGQKETEELRSTHT